MYKEILLENKEVVKKILNIILENIPFYKTKSGYYLTTDQIVSEKLRKQYGIEYMRVYSHIPTKHSILFIKFINNEDMKVKFSYKLLEEKLNNAKKRRKRKNKSNS